MIDDIAEGVGTASGTAFARIHTLTSGANQVVIALIVSPTARLASILVTDLVVLAFVVVSAQESTETAETLLSESTVFV